MLRIDDDVYVKGDADFWTDVIGDPAATELLKGKYLKASSDDRRLKGILLFTDAAFFAMATFKAEGTLTKGERRTIRASRRSAWTDDRARTAGPSTSPPPASPTRCSC